MIKTFNHTTSTLNDSNSKTPGDSTRAFKNTKMSNSHRIDGTIEDLPVNTGRQKRHSSNPYHSVNSHYVKRRMANQEELLNALPQFLDDGNVPNTPTKVLASTRRPSISKKTIDRTPRSAFSYVADTPASPYHSSLNNSSSRVDLLSKDGIDNKQPYVTSRMSTPYVYQDANLTTFNNLHKQEPTSAYAHSAKANEGDFQNDQDMTVDRSMTDNTDNVEVDEKHISNETTDGGQYSSGDKEKNQSSNNMNNNENSNNGDNDNGNNNNNRNNGNNNNGSVPSVTVPTKKSSQALVQKLQDIYKVIVKQEIELQERCSQLTNSQTTELKQLWAIYRVNSDLINNYVTFITTALLQSQSDQDLIIGQEIVEIYRIERRLWVYGTITFLDVLKNFSNFMDPEVCSQFITHVFISISNMLADIPPRYAIPWFQRLGDLSRMAIALYPSGFIDWKLSAEHWYTEAMKYTYGHGKLYYHMSTVQQNTLEAFVNLGRSVFCQDTFIPSQQYMQLVIDNIYQRAFVERNNGNHRNAQLIEYLKHSEVMLLPSFLDSVDLQKVVLIYFQDKFGLDASESNIFSTCQMFNQNPDQLKYFFRHAPAFAESHILQLVGFGDPKNPFALLFELPKCLKERKDKKEKRKAKASPLTETSSAMAVDENEDDDGSLRQDVSLQQFFDNIDSLKSPYIFPSSLDIWNVSLKYLNITSLKCSMIVLKKFLKGPLVIALPHILPWAYFIIAIASRLEQINDDSSREFWIEFLNRILPWNTIVSFLNVLMAYMLDNACQSSPFDHFCQRFTTMKLEELIEHFNNNEDLPEVWKCWGTLWFDAICNKDQPQVDSYASVGIKDHMFLDAPIDGINFDQDDERGEKFWKRACRVIFLFKGIAERFNFRITLSSSAQVVCNRGDITPNNVLRTFSFKLNGCPNQTNADLSTLQNTVERFENDSPINTDMTATPMLSVIENESIFDYFGYRRLALDFYCYDRSGDFISASLYTSWGTNSIQGIDPANTLNDQSDSQSVKSQMLLNEAALFDKCMQQSSYASFSNEFEINDPSCRMNGSETYFVLDATTWLRHFAHVYKLASNDILRFAICLTTFQELRFLRKSKDENVVEAATRAVITVRQLYAEKRILPLRFTGNVATHIEEHLEFEEQITWRSHVDEFVFEAIKKAQDRFSESQVPDGNDIALDGGANHFNHVVLVTDDGNMSRKAQDHRICTFSTRFVFSVCNAIGSKRKVCTN